MIPISQLLAKMSKQINLISFHCSFNSGRVKEPDESPATPPTPRIHPMCAHDLSREFRGLSIFSRFHFLRSREDEREISVAAIERKREGTRVKPRQKIDEADRIVGETRATRKRLLLRRWRRGIERQWERRGEKTKRGGGQGEELKEVMKIRRRAGRGRTICACDDRHARQAL
jgi:hypothetical protein